MKKLGIGFRIELIVMVCLTIAIYFGGLSYLRPMMSDVALVILMWGIIMLEYVSFVCLGRLAGVTNGIGGGLIVSAMIARLAASLAGWEGMLLGPLFLYWIPMIFLVSGVIYFIVDLMLKRKSVVTKQFSTFTYWLYGAMSVIFAFALYFLSHAGNHTVSNIDQGVAVDYFHYGNLPITLSAIGVTILAVLSFVFAIKRRAAFEISFSSINLVATLLYDLVFFLAPVLFWRGANPVLLCIMVIATIGATPFSRFKTSKIKTDQTEKAS